MFISPLLRTLPYASFVIIGVSIPTAVMTAELIRTIAWSDKDLDSAM